MTFLDSIKAIMYIFVYPSLLIFLITIMMMLAVVFLVMVGLIIGFSGWS